MIKQAIIVIGVVASPAILYLLLGEPDVPSEDGFSSFVVPDFSAQAFEGRDIFAKSCGVCHGPYAEGTDKGPVLIHPIYAPETFADEDIARAIREGAKARHWPFGDMPAIGGISPDRELAIIAFLRAVQKANDIN